VCVLLSEAVESAKRPRSLHESKALNMGIAEVNLVTLRPIILFANVDVSRHILVVDKDLVTDR
jgi:hypothetical protein